MRVVVEQPRMQQHLLQVGPDPLVRHRVQVLPSDRPLVALRDCELRLVAGYRLVADLRARVLWTSTTWPSGAKRV